MRLLPFFLKKKRDQLGFRYSKNGGYPFNTSNLASYMLLQSKRNQILKMSDTLVSLGLKFLSHRFIFSPASQLLLDRRHQQWPPFLHKSNTRADHIQRTFFLKLNIQRTFGEGFFNGHFISDLQPMLPLKNEKCQNLRFNQVQRWLAFLPVEIHVHVIFFNNNKKIILKTQASELKTLAVHAF